MVRHFDGSASGGADRFLESAVHWKARELDSLLGSSF
jgi:hypothetical protein